MCVALLMFLVQQLVDASPFLTTWNTTNTNEVIMFTIAAQSDVIVDWGDSTAFTTVVADNIGFATVNHTYASPGLYNVSMNGQFLWQRTLALNLVDIVSWGDGFLVYFYSHLFFGCSNLRVSAPPNTQPVFWPGATLSRMFAGTSFNSPLDWDLTNVTDVSYMFSETPLNQPITFRNTQGVTTINGLFYNTAKFNQPFHFDASGLLDAGNAFALTSAFNQVVNLTNSSQLTTTSGMFLGSGSYNQPIIFNTDSVTTMSWMFRDAVKFNQPITFNTSQIIEVQGMFQGSQDFNQPINFSGAPELTDSMFLNARSFNQPVTMNTSCVTKMTSMFDGTRFDQDLTSWDTQLVTECADFCDWCGLPSFPHCSPCDPTYTDSRNLSVCSSGTRGPSVAPTTSAPTAPTTSAPTAAPSTAAPTAAPSSAAPSSAAPSAAPSSAAPSTAAPSSALSTAAPSAPLTSAPSSFAVSGAVGSFANTAIIFTTASVLVGVLAA